MALHLARPGPLIVHLFSSNRNKAAPLRNACMMAPGMSSMDSYRSTESTLRDRPQDQVYLIAHSGSSTRNEKQGMDLGCAL
jgi:hypothetical protein